MKDWRTLTTEDGIIARYLLRLDAARIERRNRDLVRMLLQGGRKMKLKDEAKEAAAKVLEVYGYPKTADAVRSEEERHGCLPVTLAAIRAALEVLGQCEERTFYRSHEDRLKVGDHLMAGPEDVWQHPTLAYFRQPDPAPDVEELARRAVKAFGAGGGKLILAMKELDEATK